MLSTSPPSSLELPDHSSATARITTNAGAAGWLVQHRQGQLHQQLSEALAAVLLACRDTDKPGEITLKIRVRPNPDYLGQVLISDSVVAKPPEQATSTAYLFDPDALRLHGEGEGQLSIPLAS